MVAYITVFNLFDHVCRFEHAFCGLNRHVCSSKFQVYCLNPLLESVRSFILGQITRNSPSSAKKSPFYHLKSSPFPAPFEPHKFPPGDLARSTQSPPPPEHPAAQSQWGDPPPARAAARWWSPGVCGAHFSANLDASFRNPKGSPLWKMPCVYIYIYIYIYTYIYIYIHIYIYIYICCA